MDQMDETPISITVRGSDDSSMRWEWNVLCGRGVDNFTVWEDGDFGHCFEQIVFSCTTHLLLTIVSLYHTFTQAHRRVAGPLPRSPALHTRLAVSTVLAVLPLLLLTLTYLYLKVHMSLVDLLTVAVKTVTWLVHTGFVFRHHRMYHVHIRGPAAVVLSFLCTAVSEAIQLRTVILHVINASPYLNQVETYVTYVTTALYVVYTLTLVPSRRPRLTHLHYSLSIEDADSLGSPDPPWEHDPLLPAGGRHVQYGGIQRTPSEEDQHLGVAEDFDNCLSKLTFFWVRSLMIKGSKGGLSRARDLYDLPAQLRTRYIEDKFTAALLKPMQEKSSTETSRTRQLSGSSVDEVSNENIVPGVSYSHGRQTKEDTVLQRSLLAALNKCFGLEYYLLGILKLCSDLIAFTGPILLKYLVSYMENRNEPMAHGYIYASGLFVSTFIGAFLSTHFNYRVTNVMLKVRAAIITTVYKKTMTVNSVTLSTYSTGEVLNFMSTDTDRIVNFCPSFHQFWSLPFQVALSLVLLYQQVGLAFLAGVAFAVILIPINRWLAIKICHLSTEMMTQKDTRVKIMSEILAGIRVIKFYAWEDHFAEKVNAARLAELRSLKGRKYLDALCVYFWATTPVLISILTFTTYVLLGNKLTAAKVFTSLALFNMLISPLNAFPWVINGLMEAWVSLKRVHGFIGLPDQDLRSFYSSPAGLQRNTALRIQKGYFTWSSPTDPSQPCEEPQRERGDGEEGPAHHQEGETERDNAQRDRLPSECTEAECGESSQNQQVPAACTDTTETDRAEADIRVTGSEIVNQHDSRTLRLENINLEVKQGSLVGVIGRVGSGKSSLLAAVLAEMIKLRGQVALSSLDTGFGFVGQEAWVQHATIRDNILFGRHYDEDRYRTVLEACALAEDLKVLPSGDMTEVGENGVTLSGGQKARLSLARAVYQDKDIYLLDDPLAALDAHVARHVYTQCISGVLEGKTRILCTHHLEYLRDADLILLMDDGRIIQAGPPSELLEKQWDNLMSFASEKVQQTEAEETESQEEGAGGGEPVGAEAALVEEEEQDTGVVKGHVYSTYWRAVGLCLAPTVLLSLLLMQASRNLSDWWLSYWVSHSHPKAPFANCSTTLGTYSPLLLAQLPDPHHKAFFLTSDMPRLSGPASTPWCNLTVAEDNVSFYLMVYGCLAGANSILTLARAFLFAYGGIRAATVIHWYLLKSVLKAPVRFFDTTPIGRIVNRFSSDLYSVDDSLPFIMNILFAQTYAVLGTIAITCYGLPWFALLLLPLSIIYYFIQKYYRQTSREIKRISSVTLSPIYAHFSESITGLSTIRALRHVGRFRSDNRRHLEENQRAQLAANAASQWLGLRLQMIGVAMVTAVAFIAVLEHHFHTVDPGLIGLAISYALSITSLLSGVVTSFAETEKQMVSVERAGQYMEDLPSEKEDSLLCMPPFWPMQGAISFHRVCLQYRDGLPLSLSNVSFETQPAEKIGVVGRTGSGKSSLLVALFRMVELKDGYITVDGLNLAHLDLRELRSRMAIIPQDPFLYSGSIRENLDPRDLYTDTQLWTLLDRCHLADAVQRLGGLDAEVAERGRHLSVGQRQLLCLARAMVTRAKILCIDEATASVDQETDALIQETIRREFAHHTIITIAHRIHTILDNDRVLVMNEGRAAEFDPPGVLLENPNSLFYGLVHGQS